MNTKHMTQHYDCKYKSKNPLDICSTSFKMEVNFVAFFTYLLSSQVQTIMLQHKNMSFHIIIQHDESNIVDRKSEIGSQIAENQLLEHLVPAYFLSR